MDYADSYWFDDGYGDHIRNYLWAMGAIPEFAPAGENHLLRSSSVVTHVVYSKTNIAYRTFDPDASEVLRLKSLPARVTAGPAALTVINNPTGEWYSVKQLAGGDFVVRVRH